MERRLVLVAACAFVVAAVLYSAWLPGQFATPGVDRTNGYVSELAARDQPWSGLFRLTDALAGLACLIGVACVTRDDRREWGGWLAMALFSVLTAVDALFPLDCAALGDPACERRPLSLSHHVHAVTSVLAVGAVIAAMVLLGLRFRSRVAWTLAVAMGAVSVFMLAAMTHQALVGAAQRAQLALIACWLLYLGVRLLTREPAVPADAPRVRQAGGKHVVRQGAGPAVIIASGMAGAWYHWDRVAGELARDHLVTRFDRPGLGLSGPPSGPPTLYGEAARLAALAPAHPEHVTIVAHSVAAWHAEAFARLHPLRVAALVLVDPAPEPPRGSTQTGRAIGLWLPLLGETWGAQGLAWLLG
ncbi:MAG: alpha/beta fold hydrolase, partial [Nonomuraea sp.]|nr:alpha/beta fold hydrolase [Nonomuraea sp.]